MQKFQELLTEAAQLKQSQLKNQRKNYQSLPEYLKAGLNFAKKYKQLRKQNYLIQITISQKLKKEGNNLFKKQQFPESLSKYEEALSIFRYIDTKSYDNMKDEDLIYASYSIKQEDKKFQQQYKDHLTAIYLNICSCLTKLNRKEDSLHSADQALKIQQTAKAYYKKAQCYLQYINRQTPDIKLGFYYLNKCYEISKDQTIIQQMHRIKKQIDQQRDKQKKWFKFMFDKSKQETAKQDKKYQGQSKKSVQPLVETNLKHQEQKNINLKNMQREINNDQKEDERLEKTKQKLVKYVSKDLTQPEWIQNYQGQFIAKNGSKIYSIIQLYGYRQYLGQYKSIFAQCLQLKKIQSSSQKKRQMYRRYFDWLKGHPIDKIAKYIERYELQTQWIRQQRKIRQESDKNTTQKIDEFNKNIQQKTLEKPPCNQNTNILQQKDQKSILEPEKNHINSSVEKSDEIFKNNIERSQQKEEQQQKRRQQKLEKLLNKPESSKIRLVIFLLAFFIILLLTAMSLL